VYARLFDEAWEEPAHVWQPDNLWQLIQSELSGHLPELHLPQHLVKEISGYMLTTKLAELTTLEEGLEIGLLLYAEHSAKTDFAWNTVHDLAALGDALGHPGASVISLPCPFDMRYTSYQVTDNHLTITLRPNSVEGGILPGLNPKAKDSLQWVLENYARPSCEIRWPKKDIDATELPFLPETIQELTLCNMPRFLWNRVPWNTSNSHHWIWNFSRCLQHVRRLTLVNCGYNADSVRRLRVWLKDAQIDVDPQQNRLDVEIGIETKHNRLDAARSLVGRRVTACKRLCGALLRTRLASRSSPRTATKGVRDGPAICLINSSISMDYEDDYLVFEASIFRASIYEHG